jgi:superfamily II DNA or RNA helicase
MEGTPGPARLLFDQGTLLLAGLGADERARLSPPNVWTWDDRVAAFRCEAIHYAQASASLRATFGPALSDEVPIPPKIAWAGIHLPPLRPEQGEAIEAWHAAGRRGQIIMPSGTGKTEVALSIMAETGVSTLVVAPVRDLMYQWHRRILRGLTYDAGIVGDNLWNVKPVTVTTYDSATIHMGELGGRFGLVVFDEAHHLPGRRRREAAILSAAPMRLGLTATPERADGLHVELDTLIGPVIYRMNLPDAAGTVLADYHVVRIPVRLTPEEEERYTEASRQVRALIAQRRKTRKDYDWQDLCAESGKDPEARRIQKAFYFKKSIEDRASEKLRVLEDLFRLHADERILVFAGSNVMAIDVSRRFLVPTILSHTRKRERLTVLEGFAAGRFPVLVANQVLDEGVDIPEAKVAVVIGGQASTRQAKQRLGRILRRTGEAKATLYEIVAAETREEERSRARRKSDAYERTVHRRL